MIKYLIVFLTFLNLSVYKTHASVKVTDLKCENLINPTAIDTNTPSFSWKLSDELAGENQKNYQIFLSSDSSSLVNDNATLWNSGKVKSVESIMVPYKGAELKSRSLCYWKVRVWTNKGVSAWSDIARFGVGITEKNDIKGVFIGHALSGGTSSMLRSKFAANKLGTSFLHVNSLGYHEVYLNGVKVSEDVLSPALSQMNKRSLFVTYDVTQYLKKGDNDLVIWLGQGWYKRGTFGRWEKDDPYTEPLVRAQLDVNIAGGWQTICATDSKWQTRLSGYTDTGSWNALDFGGETVDARDNPIDMRSQTLDALEWKSVIIAEKSGHNASAQMCEPNRICETLEPKQIKGAGDRAWFIDMGKVVTGWFEINFSALSSGQTIVIEYSDEVDKDGNLLEQKQKDTYIARGSGSETFINKFNHHAFRYVKIHNLGSKPQIEDVKSHLIRTNYTQSTTFECSDSDMNSIHNMVQYTMQCLAFSGYMVDCPHLERAGYGGDGNASTKAIQTMYDVSPLFENWIQSWSDAMRHGGSLPHVAPNAGAGGGGPYWCGFIVMAPWQTYLNYGNIKMLERYYPFMQQWIGYVDKYTVDGLLKRWPDTEYRDWFLGDWLAPWGVDTGNDASITLVTNCFISDCFGVMEKIAKILGKEDDEQKYAQKKKDLNQLLHAKFFDKEKNTYATSSQLDMTYPMLTGVTPQSDYYQVKQALFATTQTNMKGHIGGGLMGIPIITEWAIDSKSVDYMYSMLKKNDYPGYLNMIRNGATTTWEYWSGERSRVHNCYNGIGTWFYHALGGLKPDPNSVAYRHVIIDPQIPEGVSWSKITKETPYGNIKLDWKLETNTLTIDVSLPSGTTAEVVVPQDATKCQINGKQVSNLDKKIVIKNGANHIRFSLRL